MDADSWSFYIILIIVILIAKLLIVISVCCVNCNRKRQRVIIQRRTIVQANRVHDLPAPHGYGQNTTSSSEFQPAFQPGPNGILGVYPPPYSEHTPKPPPYSPSNVYTAPTQHEESMTAVEDPRVDISQTDGLVTRI